MIFGHKKLLISVFLLLAVLVVGFVILYGKKLIASVKTPINSATTVEQTTLSLNPLSIEAMRGRSYPGSAITIEQELSSDSNYKQYITSYISDGLKIYALLTVPIGEKPIGGWPVIVFNHGYIPPTLYQTTIRYEAYVVGFAKNGYIVFKPDYRGNGNSQGQPEGAYYSPAYAIDDLNAIDSIKQYKDANPDKIGVWGHSMGGNITLRDLVISKDIKVAVIWGGVVGSYSDLMYNWQNHVSYNPPPNELALRNRSRQNLLDKYGTPTNNPDFWNSIDPTCFVSDITAPVQLDVGASDEEVPIAFSQSLRDKLLNAGKTVEYYEYPGSNHNISQGFTLAMERSVAFFNKYLK